jgi:hypothetical protein
MHKARVFALLPDVIVISQQVLFSKACKTNFKGTKSVFAIMW